MARSNTVKVSDEELSALHEARQNIFGSEGVAFGEVIKTLVNGPEVTLDNAQSGGPQITVSYNGGRYWVARFYPRCGCDNQDMIYWDVGEGPAELLADMPNEDGIDLTQTPAQRGLELKDGPLLSSKLSESRLLRQTASSAWYELPDGTTMTVEVTGMSDAE